MALSPDLKLSPGAPFPWLSQISPNHKHTVPIMSGCITLAIMQETIRHTPKHKAAGPDGVLGMILNHMPPVFYEAL
jgi:hypothetical protein